MAVSDADAVRKCLDALGDKADVPVMVTWIKDNLKLTLSPRLVGLYRHHILRNAKKAKRKERLTNSRPVTEKATDGVSMADLATLRDLMGRRGKGTVTKLVEMVS